MAARSGTIRSKKLLLASCVWFAAVVPLFAQEVSFRRDLAPLLLAQCHGCHNERNAEGSFRVDSFAALLRQGDSGREPITAGKVDQSELFRRLVTDDEDERMPLDGDPLPAESIALVRQWIRDGAKYDAEDKQAPLPSVLPITRHPAAPKTYKFTIPITAVSFLENDLLVGGYHEMLRWNWKKAQLVARIAQVGERIYAIESDVSSDRLFVASGTPGRLGEVRVFDAASFNLLGAPVIASDAILDAALSPSGGLLAAGGADARIHLVDTQTLQAIRTIGSHSDWVHAVSWNATGTQLASASRDRTAKLFDATSDRVLATYTAHEMSVSDIAHVPEQADQWVSCDASGKFQLWTSKEGKKLHDLDVPGTRPGRVLTNAGVWCLSSQGLTKVVGENVDKQLHGFAEPPISAAVHPSGRWIATGDASGNVSVWDTQTGRQLARFAALPGNQRQGQPRRQN